MRSLRLAACGFVFAGASFASAIVAAIFPDAIYIAADSRYTHTTHEASEGSTSERCKIVQTGDTAFAASALTADNRTGFDFEAIARRALASSSGPFVSRVRAVDDALAPSLRRTVAAIQQDLPEVYASFAQGHVGQAVFAGWEAGHPVLIEDHWEIAADGGIRHDRPVSVTGDRDDDNVVILGSGSEAILKYVADHPDWWMAEPVEALDHLIRAAIDEAAKSDRPDVGGEVSILEIDARGQRWVRNGSCRRPGQE